MEHAHDGKKTKAEPTSVSKKGASPQRPHSRDSLTRIPRWTNFAYGDQAPPSLRLPTAQPPTLDGVDSETMSITGDHLGIRNQLALEAGPRETGSLQARSEPIQNRENHTGMPDTLKAGIETLSGISIGDVHVHYNSTRPAQLQALAYTQGTKIHVGPRQEQHLPHEAWHVVQQKQGRVKPTLQAKGMAVNDDPGLEKEASVMGQRAMQTGSDSLQSKFATRVTPAQFKDEPGQQGNNTSMPDTPKAGTVIQRLSSDVLARLRLTEDVNLPDDTPETKDAKAYFERKAADLQAAQKKYDDWDWNVRSTAIYLPLGPQVDLLEEALNKLNELMKATERFLGELSTAPRGAGYDKLHGATKKLLDAQWADYNYHKRSIRMLLGFEDRTMLAGLIGGADTAYDHVGVPRDKDRDASVLAQTRTMDPRSKRPKKALHTVYESMEEAVDALQDFLWYYRRDIYYRRGEREINLKAPTRRLAVVVGRSGVVKEEWSQDVQVTLQVYGDGTIRVNHFHPLS